MEAFGTLPSDTLPNYSCYCGWTCLSNGLKPGLAATLPLVPPAVVRPVSVLSSAVYVCPQTRVVSVQSLLRRIIGIPKHRDISASLHKYCDVCGWVLRGGDEARGGGNDDSSRPSLRKTEQQRMRPEPPSARRVTARRLERRVLPCRSQTNRCARHKRQRICGTRYLGHGRDQDNKA